jgi:bifunctional NMN adenylyltransferase/nudix hydrolase
MNKSIGVIIARFQTDSLSRGQMQLINKVRELNDHTIFLIGKLPAPPNATNPLPYEAVMEMVRNYVGWQGADTVSFAPIRNTATDDVWSRNVDSLVYELASQITDSRNFQRSETEIKLYCGRDGFVNWYRGTFPVVEIATDCPEVSSTQRRADIGNVIGKSGEWRRGVIWAMANLPHRTYHTVDMAALRDSGKQIEILLARKADETAWRFPGGFVEAGEKFARAAAREFYEETNLHSEDGWQILDDYIIDDWRVRGQKGVDHKTILCVGWVMSGKAEAKDDIAEVRWFPLRYVFENVEELMVKEHRVGMVEAVKKYVSTLPSFTSIIRD